MATEVVRWNCVRAANVATWRAAVSTTSVSMSDEVQLAIADGIATITLNRPQTLNAFNDLQCRALNEAVATVADDDDVRVVVLTGAGRGFSSGADLSTEPMAGTSLRDRLNELFKPSIVGLREMAKPVIAAVNGPVAGIGVAYVLAADLVVMSEEAFMMQPFININLVPDGGITWHLVRKLGHQRAFEFIVSGERVDAATCQTWGLVNRVVPTENVLEEAHQWADRLLQKAPMAIQASKRALRENLTATFEQGFALEGDLQEALGHAEDTREGIAAFSEKRTPIFIGK